MFLKYNLFGISWSVLILILTLLPGSDMPKTDLLSFDKIAHLGIFSVLVILLIIGFKKQYDFRFLKTNAEKAALGLALIYGVVIEVLQIFVPGRGFEWFDVLANAMGIGLGYGIFYFIYKW
jgi:VanZ family protein